MSARVLIVAIVLACAGCGAVRTLHTRTSAEQTTSAVQVSATCADGSGWNGSGAVIARATILTARHVTRGCKDGSTPSLSVIYYDGVEAAATEAWVDPVYDIAELDVPGAAARGETVIAAPEVGELLCADVSWPTRHRLCGAAVALAVRALANGTVSLTISAVAAHGNSGSVFYDSAGRVVGVLTNVESCVAQPDRYCATLAASVIGRLP